MPKPTQAQTRRLQASLLDILKSLGAKLDHMEESVLLADQDSASDDSDSGNGANSREFQLGLIQNEDEILQEVRSAFKRLELGTFGRCSACADWIPIRRLESLPYASYCIGCQEKSESGELHLDD
ncbi:MAG: TraR/DksA family transcriptional regulator [Planctomycetota bacterium]|jgi:DnaK suppressor protein|nr:TraR/DksA family transcriptional regulator [Planctomycetota bacterium]